MFRPGLWLISVILFPNGFVSSAEGWQHEPKVSTTVRKPHSDPRSKASTIRADVSLILVPVSVTDSFERPITALPKESFRLLEDGVEQNIVSFSREETPV